MSDMRLSCRDATPPGFSGGTSISQLQVLRRELDTTGLYPVVLQFHNYKDREESWDTTWL